MKNAVKLEEAMRTACREARRWLGATSPNPPVGAAALDRAGNLLAVAAHRRAGTLHAETALLEECRANGLMERVHAMCITLAPCNHHGRTPPCCDAIIASGVKHVAIGARDPNSFVKNDGIERLRAAGIDVTLGIEEEICRQLIYAFAYSVTSGKPWITVKRAFDENGSMIPPAGVKTFVSESSLLFAHQLRKRADALLTGSGTILADDPSFTVRHVPDHEGKRRVLAILDRRRRVPAAWLKRAESKGFLPVVYDNLDDAIHGLAIREIREILVEAGPLLSQAILKNGFWAMDVVIQKGRKADSILTAFNPAVNLPFDPRAWSWENVLPTS